MKTLNFFQALYSNPVFIAAFLSWFVAQVSKVVLTLIIDRKFNFSRMIGSGGMPSSHSSFVTAVSTAIGLHEGFQSPIFALSLVFALVVMYDASGVRLAVGKQATLLNKMIEDLYENKPIDHVHLKELIGHTPIEVFVGAGLGILIANMVL